VTDHALRQWFDDLEPGASFASRGRTITEADVVQFAALSGDMHPQHTDRQWAADGPFGERVAHGMLVLSYAVALMPFDPERVSALRGLDRVAFKRPVRLGDTITATGCIRETRELDAEHGLVGCDLRVRNQHGGLVARARVQALWRRVERGTLLAEADSADSFVPIPL
jgi:3-hydroxybutyryl-CoA dehydratase